MASQPHSPQATLSLLKLAGLALLSVSIAGCIPRSRPAPPPPMPEPEAVPEPVEQPSRLPPDETRNRVAVLVTLSGRDAQLGRSILNAANLALLDTGGERIRITAYDTAAAGGAASVSSWRSWVCPAMPRTGAK